MYVSLVLVPVRTSKQCVCYAFVVGIIEVLLSPFTNPLPSQSIIHPPPPIHSELDSYEVEAILDVTKRRQKTIYVVKWMGYGHEENTWEPLSNLINAQEALTKFCKTRPE